MIFCKVNKKQLTEASHGVAANFSKQKLGTITCSLEKVVSLRCKSHFP